MILKLAGENKAPSFFQIVGVTLVKEDKEIVYKTATNESKKKNMEDFFIVELLSDDGTALIHKYK